LFFAYHVFWPRGMAESFDWISLALCVAAFVALVRFKVGVISIVVAGAVLGLAVRFLL
jgi:chromate transporter